MLRRRWNERLLYTLWRRRGWAPIIGQSTSMMMPTLEWPRSWKGQTLKPYFMEMCPAARLIRRRGTNNGDTFFAPFSECQSISHRDGRRHASLAKAREVLYTSSKAPIPEPIQTPYTQVNRHVLRLGICICIQSSPALLDLLDASQNHPMLLLQQL